MKIILCRQNIFKTNELRRKAYLASVIQYCCHNSTDSEWAT